jgi:PKD repeat protein
MKKINLLLLLVLAFTFGCSKDEDPDPQQPITPVVDFSYTFSGNFPPVDVHFANQTINGHTWLWEFGDGSVSTQHSPVHNYTVSGMYTVKLTATSTDTIVKSISKLITIPELPTKLYLKKLIVSKMPFKDAWLQPWDPADGPDVLFQIQTPAYAVLTESYIIQNILESDLPVTWQFSPTMYLQDIGSNFLIVWAESDGPTTLQAMEGAVLFDFDEHTGYPDTIGFVTPMGKIEFDLILEWK